MARTNLPPPQGITAVPDIPNYSLVGTDPNGDNYNKEDNYDSEINLDGTEGNEQYDSGEPCQDINMNDICDPPGEFKFVLTEIDDSFFSQQDPCSSILGDNALCDNLNNSQYAWAIIDIREPFFKYKSSTEDSIIVKFF